MLHSFTEVQNPKFVHCKVMGQICVCIFDDYFIKTIIHLYLYVFILCGLNVCMQKLMK